MLGTPQERTAMSAKEDLPVSEPNNALGMLLAGAAVVAASLASFFLLYWNHCVTYRGGAGLFIGWSWMINHGYLPYRDFFCHAPVFYLLRGSALLSLFGNHFISMRACGMVERLVLGILIFLILARLFPKRVAALPTIITVVAGSCDCADPLDVYTQEALFFSVCSIACGVAVFDKQVSRSRLILLAALSGVAAGLSLFTKQTIGLACVVAAPVAVSLCLWRLNSLAQARQYFFAYVSGLVLCIAAFVAWLGANGILYHFLMQAFVTGPAAKAGNLGDFVWRFVDRNLQLSYSVAMALGLLALCWKKLIKTYPDQLTAPTSERIVDLLPTAVLAAAALAVGTYFGYQASAASNTFLMLGALLRSICMISTLYGLFALCLFYTMRLWRGTIDRFQAQAFVFASIAFGDTFMVCLSFPFYEAMITPGLALLLALVLNQLSRLKTLIFALFAFIIIGSGPTLKLRLPYYFEDWLESPVAIATKTMQAPQMAGYLLPADMADFLDETTKIIQENSKPDDLIYVYPEGALFYPLAERRCSTFSMGHNMDTVSDGLSEKDAKLLLEHPPKVLVYYRSSDEEMTRLEKLWRMGRPSGNRALMKACEELGRRFRLVKKFSFPHACKDGLVVEVYVNPQ